MIALTKAECHAKHGLRGPILPFDYLPVQAYLGGCPWRVAVASMMLCRARGFSVRPILSSVLELWDAPVALATADEAMLTTLLHPLGFQRLRARRLTRFSSLWDSEWNDMRELPGVGVYVADAVGLFCFGCVELESDDRALGGYVDAIEGAAAGQAAMRD